MSCMDPLPLGWEYDLDQQTGKYYFVDHNNKHTQWRHPLTQKLYWPSKKDTNVNNDDVEAGATAPISGLLLLDSFGNPVIETVIKKALDLEKEILHFGGYYKDKQYVKIMELLERLILELDAIEVQGQSGQRQARKNTIKEIQNLIDCLDRKAPNPASCHPIEPIPISIRSSSTHSVG